MCVFIFSWLASQLYVSAHSRNAHPSLSISSTVLCVHVLCVCVDVVYKDGDSKLVVITQASLAGTLPQGGNVYCIDKIGILPLSANFDFNTDIFGFEVSCGLGDINMKCVCVHVCVCVCARACVCGGFYVIAWLLNIRSHLFSLLRYQSRMKLVSTWRDPHLRPLWGAGPLLGGTTREVQIRRNQSKLEREIRLRRDSPR